MVHIKSDLIIIVYKHPFSSGKNEGLDVQSFISFSTAYGVGDKNKHVLQTQTDLLCKFKLGLSSSMNNIL